MNNENFKNLYEVRKTVRFELKPSEIKRKYQSSDQNDYIKLTKTFIGKYEDIIVKFENLVFKFLEDNNQEKYLNSDISIKYSWFKNYTKRDFNEVREKLITYNKKGQKRSNQVSIGDEKVEFLYERFELWLEKNNELLESLKDFLNRSEDKQKRIADLAYFVHRILSRPNFEFIRELFNDNIQDKTSQNFQEIGKTILECDRLLKQLEDILRPMQSMGLVIEKASLNYYTVNKKTKNYPKEIEKLKKKLDDKIHNFHIQNPKQNLSSILTPEISQLNDDYFIEADFSGHKRLLKEWNYLIIKSVYKFLKEFKARQKSRFYELIGQRKSFEYIKNAIPLLVCEEDDFNKIKQLTIQILEKNKKNEPAKDLAQKRGLHFDVQKDYGKYCSFPLYKDICELYKNVAVKLGETKAKIKALEKEEVDALRVNSWALLLEKENQHYLCTIAREGKDSLLNAKKYVDSLPLADQKGRDWKIFIFESLTLRALEKLCFGYDKTNEFPDKNNDEINKNTFFPEIKKEISDDAYLKRVQENYQKFEYLKSTEKLKKIIKFYKKVLGLKSTKRMLAISSFVDFNSFIKGRYSTLEDFEKTMKKVCYFKKSIAISEEIKNKLISDFNGNLYKITSYDLEKNDKEILDNLENKNQLDRKNPEKHTQLWLEFWTNKNEDDKYPIRLNPEIKISYIAEQKEDIINKYGEKRDVGKLGKNRRNKERYLLSTTVTECAHEQKTNLSFKKREDVKNFIANYNKKFNKSIKSPFDTYYYGLDRGQKELLTLGIFKFSKDEKISFTKKDGKVSEYHKPLQQELDIWELQPKKYTIKYKNTESYKNISNVIDDENFIIKKDSQACVDLSCAKLIKNKIVINGDIATYLELKRVSALRKIWEGESRKKFRSEKICFDANKNALFLNIENRGNLKNEYLYYFDERFKDILSLDEIKKELQQYFDKVREENFDGDIISIEKINNLRDALCANAVGILNFLQEKYFGIMFFEDLDKENKNKRISEFSGNLASRIEWKLLQTFRTKNLVPPTYKQVMNLQSKKEINQLGVLGYIKTSGTSSNCPHCENKITDKTNKWGSHNYKCENKNCHFDTSDISKRKGLDFCDNSDSVAAYNIAKRGLELIIKKIEEK